MDKEVLKKLLRKLNKEELISIIIAASENVEEHNSAEREALRAIEKKADSVKEAANKVGAESAFLNVQANEIAEQAFAADGEERIKLNAEYNKLLSEAARAWKEQKSLSEELETYYEILSGRNETK